MTVQELELILQKKQIFEQFGIDRLGIFGSFARGEVYKDIDFLLEDDLDYATRQRLKRKLVFILKTKIDIVPQKFVDPIILYRAKKDLKYVIK